MIGLIPDDARAVDFHRMAVAVLLVGLHRQHRLPLASLLVLADDVLVDVDDVFHSSCIPPTAIGASKPYFRKMRMESSVPGNIT